MRKGMHVSIYKPADMGDCTNGGVTSKATEALLVGPVIEICHDPSTPGHAGCDRRKERPDLVIPEIFADRGQFAEGASKYPVLRVELRHGGTYVVAVPADIPEGTWTMFGGNFIYTSDSRLRAICPYPIPVHDRIEP